MLYLFTNDSIFQEQMVLRHHNEAESLNAVQKMDWEWKLGEIPGAKVIKALLTTMSELQLYFNRYLSKIQKISLVFLFFKQLIITNCGFSIKLTFWFMQQKLLRKFTEFLAWEKRWTTIFFTLLLFKNKFKEPVVNRAFNSFVIVLTVP